MKISLKYKITFIFGIIVAVTFIGIYSYLNKNLTTHTYSRIKGNILRESSLAKSFLEENYSTKYSLWELDKIADKIGADLNLRVTIIDFKGEVLGDSELDGMELQEVENHLYRPEVQAALKSGTGENRRFSTTIKKDMLYMARTFEKNELKGVIRLSMPLLEVEMISYRLKKILLISLLVAFAITILISFLASIFISKPIQKISLLSKEIAHGNFARKVLITSNDEIGDLAKTFNFMTEQIKLRIQEVTINKSRLEAVLFSMFEGVMVVDLDGKILLMNQTLKDFLQVREIAVGKRPIEVVRNIEIQEIVDKTIKLENKVQTHEISMLLPEERIALVHATPVVREDKSEGVVLVFHDITELRSLEKIRKDFVANVSHKLRTPVTSIKGYAETLISGALEDKKNAKDFLKIIYSDSDRLAKLIDDLLDLSKIESGKLKINLKTCPIRPIIERVIAGMDMQIREKSIRTKIDIPDDLVNILADETAIAQVLLNLIDNAVKYNCDGGKVKISAESKDNHISISITDTGIGIPDDDIPRIFERFYRVDKAHSREIGGTGLGLSIVKHIVSLHNGEVSAQSTEGQGSTFSFTIPKA